jgi:molecular chaperone Hsp33
MGTFSNYKRRCTSLFIVMLQFIWVRSFCPPLVSSLGRRQHSRAAGLHQFARIRPSLSSQSNDRDSRKAKEAVTDYVGSGLAPLEDYANPSNREDQVFSAISEDGSVKITVCTARNLVNDLMIMHTMTAVPADAIGRTAVCALMMSNGMQEEQTCQITLNGDGPLRGAVAISDGVGNVRAYVGSPMLGDIELPEAVGKGMVQVVKNHPDWKNPYNGITSIRHGDIDRDIGMY